MRTPTQQPQPTRPPQSTDEPKPTEPPKPNDQPKPTEASSYIVQAGDSLSAIASTVYGNSNDWHALYDANRDAIGDNPNLIRPGTELVVPQKQ
jgi:nucleoid-associated protein YgaU